MLLGAGGMAFETLCKEEQQVHPVRQRERGEGMRARGINLDAYLAERGVLLLSDDKLPL